MIKINDDLYYEFSTDESKYNELLQNIKFKKSIYTNKLNGMKNTDFTDYKTKMNNIMLIIKSLMYQINPEIVFDYNTNYILRKIYGKTRLHIDGIYEVQESNINFIKDNIYGNYKMVRESSIIFGLNDDYDGGLFNFPYYDVSLKLKKGSVLIFPPFWTHKHQVYELENNTYRYTISTWSCRQIK